MFLDQQMRVCSLDLEKFTREYHRQFFIPEEWLSVNRGLILKLTPKLDLVFVKRDEVAITQNGLKYKDAARGRRNSGISCILYIILLMIIQYR